jgi:hypothetical protein
MPTQEQPNNSVQFISCQLKLRIGSELMTFTLSRYELLRLMAEFQKIKAQSPLVTPEVMHWLMQSLNRLQKQSGEQS